MNIISFMVVCDALSGENLLFIKIVYKKFHFFFFFFFFLLLFFFVVFFFFFFLEGGRGGGSMNMTIISPREAECVYFIREIYIVHYT